jgi:threonine dehydrogenase-like Zn-dependent dehydrogenase
MKVLQIVEPGKAVWRDEPTPEPAEDEVLVRVEGVTACPHWDMHILGGEPMFEGMHLPYPYYPGQPGHEVVGEVATIGAAVLGFELGQRVAVWRDGGPTRKGGYAQYVPVLAENLLPVPDDLAPEAIASLELAMCVQVSFDQLIQIDAVAGRRFGVSGLGPAGLIAVQMARAYGAAEVVGIDPLAERRSLAEDLGADTVLPPDAQAFPPDREGDPALHAALDTTGLKISIDFLMQRARHAVAIFGVLREDIIFGPDHWYGNFSLIGYGEHNRGAGERALKLIEQGDLDLTPLVTHTLPLHRYEEGVAMLRNKEAIKILFQPWA